MKLSDIFHEVFETCNYLINCNNKNNYSLEWKGDRVEFIVCDDRVSVNMCVDEKRYLIVELYNKLALETYLNIYQTYLIESGELKKVLGSRKFSAFFFSDKVILESQKYKLEFPRENFLEHIDINEFNSKKLKILNEEEFPEEFIKKLWYHNLK